MDIKKAGIASSLILLLTACQQDVQVTQSIPTPDPSIQVIELKDPSFYATKIFTGVVHSQEKAGIAFRVPGTIDALLVKTGDRVSEGQVIARLDPHDYQVALEELEARMIEARSVEKLARSELGRVRQAISDDAIASVNLDRAISGHERSISAVKVVQKNIERAEDTLGYTELRAPFSGVIASTSIEQHEQVLPGIAIATLQNNTRLEVDIDVPENLIHEFGIGQSALLSWYLEPDSLSATVSEIATEPHLIKQTYTVTLVLDELSDRIFPGKSVTVKTQIAQADDSYCMPYSALLGHGDEMSVNTVADQVILPRTVELTSIDASKACVRGDFSEGDLVVVSGSHYLSDGDTANRIVVREW